MQWQRLEASHWPELSALLDTALELPHDARAAWLEALVPQHPLIKECLRKLLAAPRRSKREISWARCRGLR